MRGVFYVDYSFSVPFWQREFLCSAFLGNSSGLIHSASGLFSLPSALIRLASGLIRSASAFFKHPSVLIRLASGLIHSASALFQLPSALICSTSTSFSLPSALIPSASGLIRSASVIIDPALYRAHKKGTDRSQCQFTLLLLHLFWCVNTD